MDATLHITNGDSAMSALRAGGVTGAIVPWRDVLHDGPVPNLPWPELRKVRARFIASRGWSSYPDVLSDFTRRDEALIAALEQRADVALWFEHDLYDQLQLIQVLAMAAPMVRDGAPVALIQADDYIGRMTPPGVRAIAARASRITPAALAVAEEAWAALTAESLDALERFAHANVADDADPLPYLRPALQRLLQEVPNPVTGLSRTELQTLRAIAAGARTVQQAYVAAHHDAESPVWMGDAAFVAVLNALSAGARPLVTCDGDVVGITDDGRAVIEGKLNRVALCGVDRWIGGVHLKREPGG